MKNAFNFRPWMVLAVLLTYSLGTWAQSITLKGIVKDDFGESAEFNLQMQQNSD